MDYFNDEYFYNNNNHSEIINAPQMYYLLTKSNVFSIYESFCEYLQTLHSNSRNEFIHLLIDTYNLRRYRTPLRMNYTDSKPLKEAERRFKNFLENYVKKNAELEIYREEIINMKFDHPFFIRGALMFQDLINSSSCLK